MSKETPHRQSTLDPQNPWPGLKPFGVEDAAFFQGRAAKVKELFSWVSRATVTVFYGRSGLGKTSLLQAGLFPQLRQADYFPVLIRLDHSRTDSAAPSLVSQVKQKIAETLAGSHIDAPACDSDETLWAYFHRQGLEFWDERNRLVQPVLIFDQFEEIYTHGRETKAACERADAFLDELEALTENRPPSGVRQQLDANPQLARKFDFESHAIRVVLTVREDYLPFLLKQRRRFSGVSYNQCRLEPMTGEEAWEALLQPGGANLIDEPTALRILEAITASHESGAQHPSNLSRSDLPDLEVDSALLSVVCRGLNEARQQRGLPKITIELVEELHGSILDRFYESALSGLPRQTRHFIEDRLLSVSGDYRQTVALEEACESGDITREQADLLVDRRLLHMEERHGVPQLELSHDRLTQVAKKSRESRRRKEQLESARRRTRRLTAAALALSLAVIGLIWAWARDYDELYRHHDYYYAKFATKWGVPHGIHKTLSLDEVKQRGVSMKFTYQGRERRGKLLSMAAVDSHGKVTTHHAIGTYLRYGSETTDDPRRDCQWEYAMDVHGNLISEMAFDRQHHLVWAFNLSAPIAENGKKGNGGTTRTGFYAGPGGLPLRTEGNKAPYVRITYDKNGYETRRTYQNGAGKPLTGLDGAFGQDHEYNEWGARTKTTSLDADLQPMNDESWNAILEIKYDDSGNEEQEKAYDAKGNPTLISSWYHRLKLEHDRWGNETRETYFGIDGKTPCMTNDGYAGLQFEYLDGRRVSTTYLGLDGTTPCLTSFGVARSEREYDEQGNEIRRSFYDTNHKRSLSNDHIAGWTNQYDKEGYLAKCVYFGLDGKTPCLSKDGYAGWTSEFDDRGNETMRTYLGMDGTSCYKKKKIAVWRAEYDDQGRQTKISFYGPDGKTPCLSDEQIAGWKSEYNELGYEVKQRFFGVMDEDPCINNKGYAGFSKEYNGYGKLVRETFVGLRKSSDGGDIPILDQADNVAGWKYEYDRLQRVKSVTAIDTDGKPCLTSGSYSRVQKTYDTRGLITQEKYLGLDGMPCLIKPLSDAIGGFAIMEMKRDERGRLNATSLLDANGKPCIDSEGIAGLKKQYDDPKHPEREIRRSFFGIDGKTPRLSNDGVAGWENTYDAKGRVEKVSLFGVDGTPCLNSGIAGWKSTYNNRDLETKREFFGIDGKTPCLNTGGIAGWQSDYDPADHETRTVFLGLDGHPVQSAVGVRSGWEKEYDARGNLIREADLDVDLKPLMNDKRYATRKYTYDASDRQTRAEYFNSDGTPCLTVEDIAGVEAAYDYDPKNHRTIKVKRWLDTDLHKYRKIKRGDAGTMYVMDERGNTIESAYLGEDGKPLMQKEGYAILQMEYDEKNRQTKLAYLDSEHKPCLYSQRYAGVLSEYDAQDRIAKQMWVNLKNEPCLNEYSYASAKSDYNDKGKLIRKVYFGVNGRPCLTTTNIAGWWSDYDETGLREIKRTFFDVEGKPCLHSDGFAGWRTEFNGDEETFLVTFAPDGTRLRVIGVSMIRLTDVFAGSQAAQVGLARGDVLVKYADWSPMRNNSDPKIAPATRATEQELLNEVRKPGSESRDLWVWRELNDKTWKLLKFSVKPGKLGIGFRSSMTEAPWVEDELNPKKSDPALSGKTTSPGKLP